MRSARKGTQNKEIRSTKSEIRNKFKTGDTKQGQCSKQEGSDSVFGFSEFEIYLTTFVSDFELRISDFVQCVKVIG